MASASVIEKQSIEGDHNDAPMETEASFKDESKDDVVCRNSLSSSSNKICSILIITSTLIVENINH